MEKNESNFSYDDIHKYTSEMNQEINETHSYFNCFAFDEEKTSGNRFSRYVTKTKKNLMSYLKNVIRVCDKDLAVERCKQNSIMDKKYNGLDLEAAPNEMLLVYGHSDSQGKLYPGSFEAVIFNILKTCTYVETCMMLKNKYRNIREDHAPFDFSHIDEEDEEDDIENLFSLLENNTFSKQEIPFAQGLHSYRVSNYDFLWNTLLSKPDKNGKRHIDVEKIFKPVDFYEEIDPDTSSYFKEIVNYELEQACRQHIAEKFLEGQENIHSQEINENNYFTTIPETTGDCIKVLENILNWVKIDIERKYQSNISEAFSSAFQKDIHKKMLKLKKQNTTILEKAKKDLEAKDIVIKKKDNALLQLKKKTSGPKETQPVEEYCHQLERQNLKLQEKYMRMFEKYETLKKELAGQSASAASSASASVADSEFEELQPVEIDYEGRYVFVMKDFAYTKTIQETFPNARIIDQNTPLDGNLVSMVIIITGCIDHSTYYGIKSQCKEKNIPMIHCNNTNIELIKNLIWNYINT